MQEDSVFTRGRSGAAASTNRPPAYVRAGAVPTTAGRASGARTRRRAPTTCPRTTEALPAVQVRAS